MSNCGKFQCQEQVFFPAEKKDAKSLVNQQNVGGVSTLASELASLFACELNVVADRRVVPSFLCTLPRHEPVQWTLQC